VDATCNPGGCSPKSCDNNRTNCDDRLSAMRAA
jgi:hypothetical protein